MARPVTTELIARTGAALAGGGWRYTPRQLYYATCAAAETPRRDAARGQLAVGVLLGLLALVLLPFRTVALALGAAALLVLALGALTRLRQPPLAGRVLAVSFAEFESLLRAEQPPPGLIDIGGVAGAARAGSEAAPPGADSIVCDTAETAAAVRANLRAAGTTSVRVLTLDESHTAGRAVAALHDASPSGCALPLQLRAGHARVVDAGLRPAWVDGAGLQLLEGAPARLPCDLSHVLSEAEIAWLLSGRRVELAVLPPERLMRLVHAALDRLGAPPDPIAAQAGIETAMTALP